MIWQSTAVMTVLDLILIGLSVTCATVALRFGRGSDRQGWARGPWLTAAAAALLGLFYLVDLLTMYVGPLVLGTAGARRAMEILHQDVAWLVMLAVASLMVAGLVVTGRTMTRWARDLSALELELAEAREQRGQAESGEARAQSTAETVIANSLDGIGALDSKGRITLFSPAMEAFSGRDADDVLGKRALDAFPHLLRSDEARLFGDALEGRAGVAPDLRYTHPVTGRELAYDATVCPLRDETGDVSGVLVIIRDRSAWKRSEALLRESNNRFRTLAAAAFEGIGVAEAGVVLEVNDRLAEMCGYTRDEMVGMHVSEMVAPEHREIVRRHMLKRGAEDLPYEHLALRRDGSVFPVEVHGKSMSLEGRDVRVTAVRDITDRRAAEEAIRVANERLQALASRIQSVREDERAGIARELHDELGQLMTSLRLELSMFRDELPRGELVERVTAMIETVDDNIARIQSLSARLRPPILDLFGLSSALEWLVEDVGSRTSVELTSRIDDAVGREVDPGRSIAVFRIVQEALTNVLRHAEASRVVVQVAKVGAELHVEVVDDGVGLDVDVLGDISSLGLIGMMERAEAFGGSLQLGPGPSGGTVVALTMPVEAVRARSGVPG